MENYQQTPPPVPQAPCPQRRLEFGEAVQRALQQNYCNFSGRASLSEYWWFDLFTLICGFAVTFVGTFLGDTVMTILSCAVNLYLLLPSLGLSFRRLHDTDRGGQWLWLSLIPIIGWAVLIIFFVQASEPRANRFGEIPNLEC